jgi:hypothetical protein
VVALNKRLKQNPPSDNFIMAHYQQNNVNAPRPATTSKGSKIIALASTGQIQCNSSGQRLRSINISSEVADANIAKGLNTGIYGKRR